MSYRSFTDIVGESSLERKCRFLFGLCLLVLITGSFWWYGFRTEELVYTTTRSTGRHFVDATMLQSHWEKLEPDKEFTGLIEQLGSVLRPQQYRSWVLDPKASPEEKARQTYSRLDNAVLEYFVNRPVDATAPAIPGDSPEYREFRTADNKEYHYYQPVR